MDNRTREVGSQILEELIDAFFHEQPYYVSNRFGKHLTESDMVFITDEDIIDYIKQELTVGYRLEVSEVSRLLNTGSIGEDFFFHDTELKIHKI